MPDQRQPRFKVDLSIRVFGIDADGRPFSQIAHARNISGRGAKLSGVEKRLGVGDIVGKKKLRSKLPLGLPPICKTNPRRKRKGNSPGNRFSFRSNCGTKIVPART
jgi:hypothetical protein